jgi:hypothetical protein
VRAREVTGYRRFGAYFAPYANVPEEAPQYLRVAAAQGWIRPPVGAPQPPLLQGRASSASAGAASVGAKRKRRPADADGNYSGDEGDDDSQSRGAADGDGGDGSDEDGEEGGSASKRARADGWSSAGGAGAPRSRSSHRAVPPEEKIYRGVHWKVRGADKGDEGDSGARE